MKTRQKIIIIALCAAPVLIGMWLLGAKSINTASGLTLKKIGLVQVTDVILASDSYVKQLQEFREDASIAGVLLRIDSPGGASVPSQEIYAEVMKFRDINKPLVVSMGNMATSGGYYIASPAMRIFANKSSITGSIGVIFKFPQYYKLLDKLGVSMQVFKSGAMKDVGSPDREVTAEDKKFIQGIIDNIHEQFIEDVSRARSIDINSLRKIADGRIMTGEQAIKADLVDTLGTYDDALSFIKAYAGVARKSTVVEKKKTEPFLRSLLVGEIANRFPLLKNTISPSGSYFLFQNGF